MNLKKKFSILIAGILLSVTIPATAIAATYNVIPGDTINTISRLFKAPISKIMSDNLLTTDKIIPGQKLTVPAKRYTIQSGDTLYKIAKKYGIPLSLLRKANAKWDDFIIAGNKLTLPGVIPASQKESVNAKTVIPFTPSEIDLLARLIYAEAGGESYSAMKAVGGVVVNRVQSTEWPNTISAVINHVIGGYYQFTPVKNGFINNPASTDAIKAAWAAMYGSDPSKHAMFYFDDTSKNQWLWSKTVTVRIDNMVFVK